MRSADGFYCNSNLKIPNFSKSRFIHLNGTLQMWKPPRYELWWSPYIKKYIFLEKLEQFCLFPLLFSDMITGQLILNSFSELRPSPGLYTGQILRHSFNTKVCKNVKSAFSAFTCKYPHLRMICAESEYLHTHTK